MKLTEIKDTSVPKSIKGWMAIGDAEGQTNGIEGIYVFKSEADADKYQAGLDDDLDGSDAYTAQFTLDEYFVVMHLDHRADEDDITPIMFDPSRENLLKRLKKDIADGAIYGVSSWEEVEDDVNVMSTD